MRATAGTSIDSDLDHLHEHSYVVVPRLLSREQIDRISMHPRRLIDASHGARPDDRGR